jgi:hypothetical protein
MNRRLFILGILLGVASAAWSRVPATFFGMTINHAPIEETMWPEVPIGAIRLWDTGTSWRAMNPAPGVYEWSKLDQWFRIAKRHDVDILYTFGRTPDWASSNLQAECSYGKGQCAPPKDLRAWDDFVRALATHAAGRIKYWEIWNEANQPESWTGSLPQLVDMARRAKAIIQAIDPKAVLLTPSATGKEGPGWLSAYLDAKGGHSADVIAFHGYCGPDPENIAVLLEKYKKIAAARGLEKKPLWDTEASWGKSDKLPSKDERAAYLAIAYLLHLSNGVERFYWYAWDNNEWGTLARGSQVEPAGQALRQVADLMQSATLDKPCTNSAEGVWSCGFTSRSKGKILATWSPRARTIAIPGGFTRVSNLAGKQGALTGTVALTPSPVFLFQEERGPLTENKR